MRVGTLQWCDLATPLCHVFSCLVVCYCKSPCAFSVFRVELVFMVWLVQGGVWERSRCGSIWRMCVCACVHVRVCVCAVEMSVVWEMALRGGKRDRERE